jgi:arylformamidase
LLKSKRIVDLTRVLTPGGERFRLDLRTFFVDELQPDFRRPEGEWYILQEWQISSHLGTHIESPYHHIKDGADVSMLSIQRLIGEAVVLDFRHKRAGQAIELEELRSHSADIRAGDMVLIHTGFDREYGKPDYDRPYLALASLQWLVDRGITCLGIDASGIEKYKAEQQPGHLLLFSHGIPVIEELTNLDKLESKRVLLIALPLPIRTADSCPIRAVAIEEV